ncbi:GDSL-type esterase/lipase family protein [Kitasatospora sp. NBC_01266]|uniref:GDSL-type esterase/lipase family protein n=1 Tax=Kitasatospora sp. NBC_01266 TaxID=2903572 RepID=UPI002E3317FE|nr:GDSL-type esterase/lipase family protein [Kitasatospora sp. NBC_01266]
MLERSPCVKRSSQVRRPLAALLALPLCASGLLALAVPANAAAPAGPTVSVTLGDSYISGEAGRWQGNSDDTSGSRDGTDRAWNGSGYDASSVYGSTYASGCDRSDVAEVNSATGIAQTSVNLACSGATTANVFRAADGGQSLKGEAPQADQLAALAAKDDVKLITLSIGGNDLGFSDVITSCAEDYVVWDSYCAATEQSAIESKMPAAMAGVGKSIDEIRAAMAGDGYAPSSYRIVLQSYPSPIPRSSENRYSESGWDRVNTGGCPFWNADSDWARDTMVPEVSDQLAQVAAAKGVQFMDLRDFLQGREVCSTATQLATPDSPPSATTSEWARFVDAGTTTQGTTQESMHPNYYAQQALGRCLTLLWAQPSGNFACRNTPGEDASGMYLTAS